MAVGGGGAVAETGVVVMLRRALLDLEWGCWWASGEGEGLRVGEVVVLAAGLLLLLLLLVLALAEVEVEEEVVEVVEVAFGSAAGWFFALAGSTAAGAAAGLSELCRTDVDMVGSGIDRLDGAVTEREGVVDVLVGRGVTRCVGWRAS